MGGNNRKNKLQEKLITVQRLINIRTAKAYRTASNDALCIITRAIPLHIKIKETAGLYKIVRRYRHNNLKIDHDKLPKEWLHPADGTIATKTDNTQEVSTPIDIYTDGSKSEQGVGAGIHNRARNANC